MDSTAAKTYISQNIHKVYYTCIIIGELGFGMACIYFTVFLAWNKQPSSYAQCVLYSSYAQCRHNCL